MSDEIKTPAEVPAVEAVTVVPATQAECAPKRSCLPLVATLTSVVALAAVLTQPLWVSKLYPSAPVVAATAVDYTPELEQLRLQLAEVPALKAQVAKLAQRLELTENANPVPSLASVDFTPIESRLSALEQRPQAAAPDTQAIEQAITSLRDEMGKDARAQDAQKTLMVSALQLVTA